MALTSCLGCFSIKTGTKIIGSMTLISSLLWIIIIVAAIPRIASLELESHVDNQNISNTLTIKAAIKAVVVASLANLVIIFTLSVMLLMGTNNRKPHFVFPYLCVDVAGILFTIATCLGFFWFAGSVMNDVVPLAILILVIGSALALKIYFCLVVYHLYQELICERFGHKINPATGQIFKEPFENDV